MPAHNTERRVGRFVVLAIVLFSLWQCVFGFQYPESREHVATLFTAIVFGTAALAELLALVLAWRPNAASGSFALAMFLSLLGNAMSHVSVYRWAVGANMSQPIVYALDLALPGSVLFMTAAVVRFSALFPDPLTREEFPPRAVFRRARIAMLRPAVVWGPATALFGVAVLVTFSAPNLIRVIKPPLVAAVLIAFIVTVANLRLNYRRATPEGRRRTFWILEGFFAGVAIMTLGSLLKAFEMLGGAVSGRWFALSTLTAFVVVIVCLAIAMFFSGALDPALAIKRTAVYSVLGIALVFLFVAVENAVQDYLRAWLHLSDSSSGVIIGGGVALSVEPLKERLTTLAERVLARWDLAPGESATARRHAA